MSDLRDEETMSYLRERIVAKLTDMYLRADECGYGPTQEEEIDAILPIIESHTQTCVALALEKAANHAPWYDGKCICGVQYSQPDTKVPFEDWADHIRSLIPDAATLIAEHDKAIIAEYEENVKVVNDAFKDSLLKKAVDLRILCDAKDAEISRLGAGLIQLALLLNEAQQDVKTLQARVKELEAKCE